MPGNSPSSWGRFPPAQQKTIPLAWRSDELPVAGAGGKPVLPFGNGRSYGDVCLNDGGVLLAGRGLNRFIDFDQDSGILRCEAGVLLSEILKLAVPRGWFLPVTPGTRYVTVGGAIANDVHGKNHHRAGTFGCHVREFELLRSDGMRIRCTPAENPDWFRATIGGLGLTGMITWAEIALKPIRTAFIQQETLRFRSLAEFFDLAEESDRTHEYTVAWVDCLARGASMGRGLLMRGEHSEKKGATLDPGREARLGIPFTPPFSLVNRFSLRLFNTLYYHRPVGSGIPREVHYQSFFYPLDGIRDWNRMYGPRGFLQYQCALPPSASEVGIGEILNRIAEAGTGSFLAVLKRFGDVASPGLLSFPRPGVTLALDFPNRGRRTLELLEGLDEVTRTSGGAVNPSKDARMSPESFQAFFPRWTELDPFIDPAFSSSFWRRVTATPSTRRLSEL
jgi:FAD/FMN-containing dehydrogenase